MDVKEQLNKDKKERFRRAVKQREELKRKYNKKHGIISEAEQRRQHRKSFGIEEK